MYRWNGRSDSLLLVWGCLGMFGGDAGGRAVTSGRHGLTWAPRDRKRWWSALELKGLDEQINSFVEVSYCIMMYPKMPWLTPTMFPKKHRQALVGQEGQLSKVVQLGGWPASLNL